ncbi:uncharacterized protein MAM_01306 [Metarhizium album ARSEF 1941]|uniref:Uncharacterized protein n=1 Tax=Metarhizium album (strain ARSEF 1941) TaxID=1081103 RepID=A0A0B2X445_METAS|nr:uncharacterized protein MAM_01306 [Metarhizium album ARSEF 1941]KHO00528.1 hypothetical protein MAM_01306 [Metarhizium album ARSEF 1941]
MAAIPLQQAGADGKYDSESSSEQPASNYRTFGRQKPQHKARTGGASVRSEARQQQRPPSDDDSSTAVEIDAAGHAGALRAAQPARDGGARNDTGLFTQAFKNDPEDAAKRFDAVVEGCTSPPAATRARHSTLPTGR